MNIVSKLNIIITVSIVLFLAGSLQAKTLDITDLNFANNFNKQLNKSTKLRSDLIQQLRHYKSRFINKNTGYTHTQQRNYNQLILVDAIAKGDPKILLKDLKKLGLQSVAINGRLISGFLPIEAIDKLDELKSLNEIKNNRIIHSQGSTLSKGDHAQKSDLARQNFNVTGKGVTVGIMSDSYNCLKGAKADKQSKDLPENLIIIEEALECDGTTDEGRALMQIVHDIAPDAKLVFFSSSNGLAKTANGILDLAFKHNVDIIIDDFKSLSANFFQEDPVSQAVKRVVNAGVVYVTAAGNSGRNAYQSTYNEHVNASFQLNVHDFDPSDNIDIYQRLNIPEGVGFTLALQWDSPAYSISGSPGAKTDLDIFIFNESHTTILAASQFGNIDRDPTEILRFYNPVGSNQTQFDLMITKASGQAPKLFKYIILNSIEGIISEHQTNSSAIFGHANSPVAISVGATNYLDTPAFGKPSPLLQSYSTAGGAILTLGSNGKPLTNPIAPNKPDVIAPDNVNTTFFGNNDTDEDGKPNISGSSASAPHVAGVIALLLEINPQLQPADIKKILQDTAVDIIQRKHENGTNTVLKTGFDFDSGYGLINAEAAVDLAKNFQPSRPLEPDNSTPEEIIVNDLNQSGGGIFNPLSLLLFFVFLFSRKLYK